MALYNTTPPLARSTNHSSFETQLENYLSSLRTSITKPFELVIEADDKHVEGALLNFQPASISIAVGESVRILESWATAEAGRIVRNYGTSRQVQLNKLKFPQSGWLWQATFEDRSNLHAWLCELRTAFDEALKHNRIGLFSTVLHSLAGLLTRDFHAIAESVSNHVSAPNEHKNLIQEARHASSTMVEVFIGRVRLTLQAFWTEYVVNALGEIDQAYASQRRRNLPPTQEAKRSAFLMAIIIVLAGIIVIGALLAIVAFK